MKRILAVTIFTILSAQSSYADYFTIRDWCNRLKNECGRSWYAGCLERAEEYASSSKYVQWAANMFSDKCKINEFMDIVKNDKFNNYEMLKCIDLKKDKDILACTENLAD